MKNLIALLIFLVFIYKGYSQEAKKQKLPNAYGGIGVGLDYGGFGMKAEIMPLRFLGIFAGAGFNLEGIGYNGGLSLKLMPEKNTILYFMAMYGYNAVIVLQSGFSGSTFSETYYGPSVGAGVDFIVGKNRNKISLAVLVPFRSDDFDYDYDRFNNVGYNFNTKPTDVLVSFGFNVAGYNKKR